MTPLIQMPLCGAVLLSLFKGRCKFFVIDAFRRLGSTFTFTIYRACSNEFIDCRVLKHNNRYKLVWFSGGDY